jgi:hypothetical protein
VPGLEYQIRHNSAINCPCDPRTQPAQLPTANVLASETVVKHRPTYVYTHPANGQTFPKLQHVSIADFMADKRPIGGHRIRAFNGRTLLGRFGYTGLVWAHRP